MDGAQVLDVAREAIVTLLMVSGPIMIVALVVGILVALFQALTSIQEATLTFVPKILLVFGILLILLPFMSSRLENLTTNLFARMANPDQAPQGFKTGTATGDSQ